MSDRHKAANHHIAAGCGLVALLILACVCHTKPPTRAHVVRCGPAGQPI